MPKRPDKKHVHKFRRAKYKNGTEYYFCINGADGDCSYKISTGEVIGKNCICARCGNVFQMNTYSATLKAPHCTNCHKSKFKPEVKIDELIPDFASKIHHHQIENVKEQANNLTSSIEDAFNASFGSLDDDLL